MTIAVIGAGMIGSAAARHLACAGQDVILIGPEEPAKKSSHDGVFGSYYDAGRITRTIDPNPFWAKASAESLARYDEIAAQGGVPFYTECGLLFAAPDGDAVLSETRQVAAKLGSEILVCDAAALEAKFPDYRFGHAMSGVFEPTNAGHINPRALVQAQIAAARAGGANWMPAVVTGLEAQRDHVVVKTNQGSVAADQVLVAAGGFSNMVLPKPLPLDVYARTILMAEVTQDVAAGLQDLPPLIHYDAAGRDFYLLPPIQYPNGRFYFKIGGDPADRLLHTLPEMQAWFRSGGDASVGAFLEETLRQVLPAISLGQMHLGACVTTFRKEDLPILQRVDDRICVATAGCGRGAKCSDELGRLGAEVVLDRSLPDWAKVPDIPGF